MNYRKSVFPHYVHHTNTAKRYLRWTIFACCLLFILSLPFAATAKEAEKQGAFNSKDEVIYGNLTGNGEIESLYVVNSFQVTDPGMIKDYGKYSSIRNLTNLSDMEKEANEVTFQAEKGNFYYQGDLENKELPWDISITYLLDGKKINPEQLAGKTGHLDIQITTKANKHVNPVFFDYYVLQIAVTLDPIYFTHIQAPEATEANEGKNKSFSFTVMPEQESTLILSADVQNMKMEPINISAVPANIAIDDPDITGMTDEMEQLANAISDINNGAAELANGLSAWRNGANQLYEGSSAFRNGLDELDQSSSELIEGSEQLLQAMQQASNVLKEIPKMDGFTSPENVQQLPQQLRNGAKELQQFSDQIHLLQEEWDQQQDAPINDKQIQEIIDSLKENDADQNMIDTIKDLQEINGQMSDKTDQTLLPDNAESDMNEMVNELNKVADFIENNMEQMEQLSDVEKLQNGMKTMSDQYQSFHDGLVSYTDGVHQLAQSYADIDNGMKELTDGAAELENGAQALQNGTQKLQENTDKLPEDVQTEVNNMMDDFDYSDFEAVSFVSEKNKKTDVVQFVLQTPKIELPEKEAPVKETKSKSIWDRFLDLFK